MMFTLDRHSRWTATTSRSTGDLTLRGVTQSVTLKGEFGGVITDDYGRTKAGAIGVDQDQPSGLRRQLERGARGRRLHARRRRDHHRSTCRSTCSRRTARPRSPLASVPAASSAGSSPSISSASAGDGRQPDARRGVLRDLLGLGRAGDHARQRRDARAASRTSPPASRCRARRRTPRRPRSRSTARRRRRADAARDARVGRALGARELAGEQAVRQREERQESQPRGRHGGQHVDLDRAGEQVVLVLRRDEPRGAEPRRPRHPPRRSASASKFELPIARTLPSRTSSSSAPSVSSIGVSGSGVCCW